ncbi:RNA methyltransferase [Methylobacterium radiotolerans]
MRERDLVGRAGRFIVEGEVTLRLLLGRRGRFRAESILVAPERWPGLAADIAACPEPPPVYSAAKAVMSAVTPALVVGLAGLTNHDNVGAAFRNAAAFGADAVLLDGESCDPLYRKSIRVSAGAALIQPFARLPDGQDWLRLAETLDLQPLAFSPGATETLDLLAVPARALLILGTEGPGLDAATLARARPIRIPMAAGFDSLNVATAAGIALYTIARGQGRLGRP